jgi:hypothetical protein
VVTINGIPGFQPFGFAGGIYDNAALSAVTEVEGDRSGRIITKREAVQRATATAID